MSLRIVIGVVFIVLVLMRRADAERAIIVNAAGAPFAPADLAEAIRVRVPAAGPALQVRVTAIAGGVRVAAAGGARDVVLGDRTGVDAARLVALAASDLLSVESLADVGKPAPASRNDDQAIALAAYAGIAGWNGVLGGLVAELAIPHGAWLFAFDLGGGTLVRGPIDLSDAEARVGLGRRLGPFELRVDAVAEPLFVTTGAGDVTTLFGAGASARARIALGPTRLVLAAGADAFATRTEYRTAGSDVLTTPRIAPWLRVGVEVPL
ncbi:MAG TPA: hypothetical protein VGL61_30440 [Kofleriaceae bacterium]